MEIAHPSAQKGVNEAIANDFNITKVNLGSPSRDSDVYNFQVSATRLVERNGKFKKSNIRLKKLVTL